MEKNTDRMYWVIGFILAGALLILGAMQIFGDEVIPLLKDKIISVRKYGPNDNVNGALETDKYIYAKIKDKETANDNEWWVRADKNIDGTVSIRMLGASISDIHGLEETYLDSDDKFMNDGIVSLAIKKDRKLVNDYQFPDTISGRNISDIKWYITSAIPLKGTINLPKNLTKINDYQFVKLDEFGDNQSDISSNLMLPDRVKTIGAYAFNSIEKKGTLVLPEDLVEIGDFAFSNAK